MDPKIMQQTLGALFATFRTEPTKELLDGYVIGIGDLSAECLQWAVARAIRECLHLPRPAELRKLAGENNGPESWAIAAWDDVLRAVSSIGPWKAIDFEDHLINATIRHLGGWPAVVERFAGTDEEKWLRIEFERTYKNYAASGVDGETCRPLQGLSEKQVRSGQLVDPVPQRIECGGERQRIARLVRQPVGVINAQFASDRANV